MPLARLTLSLRLGMAPHHYAVLSCRVVNGGFEVGSPLLMQFLCAFDAHLLWISSGSRSVVLPPPLAVERSSKALEAILREHDEDSVITISSLPKIRATYRPTWGSRGPRKGEGPREGAPRVEGGLEVARAKNQEMEEFLSVAQTVRKKAEKDLAVEFSVTPKKARVTIAQHKESSCFKSGLEKMGRVSYEFGYKIAVTHFQTKHLGLEVEENPYTTLLEDDDVLMEVPFDDNDPITMKEHRFVTNLVIF
ncbi:hypothetical protein BHM03_00031313 [Ensete ventricosum]|nr:hypothetical protein BHM03_00031313 [Ensete ventricosum]